MVRLLFLVVIVVYFLFSTYVGIRNGRKRAQEEEKRRMARRMARTVPTPDDSSQSSPFDESTPFDESAPQVEESRVQRQLRQFRQQATERSDQDDVRTTRSRADRTKTRSDRARSESGSAKSYSDSAWTPSMDTAFPTTMESDPNDRPVRRRRREMVQSSQSDTPPRGFPPPIPLIPTMAVQPPALPYAASQGDASRSFAEGMANGTTVIPPPTEAVGTAGTAGTAGTTPPMGATVTTRGTPLISTGELATMFGDRRNVAKIFVMNEIFQSPLQRWERYGPYN